MKQTVFSKLNMKGKKVTLSTFDSKSSIFLQTSFLHFTSLSDVLFVVFSRSFCGHEPVKVCELLASESDCRSHFLRGVQGNAGQHSSGKQRGCVSVTVLVSGFL